MANTDRRTAYPNFYIVNLWGKKEKIE
ncbi:hypothetical protein A2U01_0084073, partial [Trifolium medium]|nr:hypothetical protein [Trifolium medium]